MYALKGSASLLAMLRTRTINILGRDYYERASIKYIHIGGRSLLEANIVLKLSKGRLRESADKGGVGSNSQKIMWIESRDSGPEWLDDGGGEL